MPRRNTTARAVASRLARSGTIRHLLLGQPKGGFDLAGEKQLDWGWVASKACGLTGRALDIGCGTSPVPAVLQAAGFSVTAIDLEPAQPFEFPNLRVIRGDFISYDFGREQFDLVVLCSAVEHFGLSGRYRSAQRSDGDIECMRKVRSLLSSGGRVILTIPIGLDYVLSPWHRVYGRDRFPRLIEGFSVLQDRAFARSPGGPWHMVTLQEGLAHPKVPQRYALGEFVLAVAD